MSIELQYDQIEKFQEALLSAFPRYEDLEQALFFELGFRLRNISGPPGRLGDVVFEAIQDFDARGQLDDLVNAVAKRRPGNRLLKLFVLEISATSPQGPGARLEATVNGMLPVAFPDWRTEMDRAQSCVGRVEIPAGRGRGTAFRTGPNQVLTNQHVAKLVRESGVKPSECGVRFGYHAYSGSTARTGQFFSFAPQWELANSEEGALDYALLQLDGEAAGTWLRPSLHLFDPNEVLIILQHPEADPLRIALGTYIETQPPLIHYSVNTKGGSSGSPVFASNWDLVALHRDTMGAANRGVLLKDIWEHLSKHGGAGIGN